MGTRGAMAVGIAVVALAAPAGAIAAPPVVEVDANGNAFAGGLSFDPPEVTVPVGGVVRWTNTDYLVPHTVTEDHRLFDLAGDYGATPANPPGFGPGESVEWRFAAGTFGYFCDVHPEDMVGQVAAMPRVRPVRDRRLRVKAIWAKQRLPDGQVFDVQRSTGGKWRTVRDGTTELKDEFRVRRGSVAFRSRVRRADDRSAASGYSPAAALAVD